VSIREFWSYFARAAPFLAGNLLNEKMQDELDLQVARLGSALSWEIGPGSSKPNALAISPGGDPDLLSITRTVISEAPPIDGWEFHPAKPPKKWDLQFSLSEGSEVVDVDARSWRYTLLDFGDGVYDLTLEAQNLNAVGDELRSAAGEALVEGILGEERRIEVIGRIDVVTRMSRGAAKEAGPIANLAMHVEELTSTTSAS